MSGAKRDVNYSWHWYFRRKVADALKFQIPNGKRVLFLGNHFQDVVLELKAEKCVVYSTNENYLELDSLKSSSIEVHKINAFEDIEEEREFDYIVCFSALCETADINQLLSRIRQNLIPSSRLIVYQHNHLWMPLLRLGSLLRIKRRETYQNWLSIADIQSYLHAFGYEPVRTWRHTLVPAQIFGLGSLINFLFDLLPILDGLKFNQFVVGRLISNQSTSRERSLTICITVRNERDNIESIVQSLPVLTKNQEILFVEGHSTDGTAEEIVRVIGKYPDKNVRMMGQPGIGQGDAIRVGFKAATGDIIILYEGDGTCNPDDISYFYAAMCTNRYEFIQGSRFVYPLGTASMPRINQIGNMIFARWFSWFLQVHSTDVLSGIKAVSKSAFEDIYVNWGKLPVEDPFGDFELVFGASRQALRMGEIPITYKPREYGQSKTKVFHHGKLLMQLITFAYFQFRRLKMGNA